MGKTVTIEVLGVDNIIKDCKTIAQTRRMKQAINKATGIVLDTAVRIVPKRNGALQQSICMNYIDTGDEYTGRVFTNMEYAVYVEYGTGVRGAMTAATNGAKTNIPGLTYQMDWAGQIAQPFMYPALKWNEQKISKMIEDAIRNEI